MERRVLSSKILTKVLALLLVSGCAEPELVTFIAFERDFQGFREWEGGSFQELPARGQTHFAGQQRYFIRGPKRKGRRFPPARS